MDGELAQALSNAQMTDGVLTFMVVVIEGLAGRFLDERMNRLPETAPAPQRSQRGARDEGDSLGGARVGGDGSPAGVQRQNGDPTSRPRPRRAADAARF